MLMNGGGKKLDLILRSGPKDRVSKDGPQAPAAILRDARKGALFRMTSR
jgi:hypothetical protein